MSSFVHGGEQVLSALIAWQEYHKIAVIQDIPYLGMFSEIKNELYA